MGLLNTDNLLVKLFDSFDRDELWRLTKDASSTATIETDQGNSSLPTTPDFRVIIFASGSDFVIGKYNSTQNTWTKYVELGTHTVDLSGTTLSTSAKLYAGAFFTNYSSLPENEVDAILSKISATALDTHYGSASVETRLTVANHQANPKDIYLAIFTYNGNNTARLHVAKCDDIFNPIVVSPVSATYSLRVPSDTATYVAAGTTDGTTDKAGRSGGFYRLSII